MASLTYNQKLVLNDIKHGGWVSCKSGVLNSLKKKGYISSYKAERVQTEGDFIIQHYSAII